MSFVNKDFIKNYFRKKSVVIFGSAPSCLENKGYIIDKFDKVVRVNNYKIYGFEKYVGTRTDVHYSFYGSSIKKAREELKSDGVNLCMCKCPNDHVVDHHKMVDWDKRNTGGDFRWIYENRKDFWFCDTYIPTKEDFMEYFTMMDGHIPTTGFSCILDILSCQPKDLYITGFDGFISGRHNVNEKWRDKSDRPDPICHKPDRELKLIKELAEKHSFIRLDGRLNECTGLG